MNIIETRNLSYVYSQETSFEKKAVDNINITVAKGEIVAIVGHTGSGKSTFVKMLNGLIKPTAGEIFIDNKNIWSKEEKIRDIRFKVGLVFQYPEHQLFEETVYKDIAFGPTNKGLSKGEVDNCVYDAARFVGLDANLLNKSPFDISGGERRRVAIAGVIAMNPDILILDEPTAGLDPRGRRLLMNQILQYHRQKKNTILFVSHNMEEVSQIANRVIVMNKGKVEMFDNTKRIFLSEDKLSSIGLEIPPIIKIMKELRKSGYEVDDTILTVKQAEDEILKLIK